MTSADPKQVSNIAVEKVKGLLRRAKARLLTRPAGIRTYNWWIQSYDRLSPHNVRRMEKEMRSWERSPTFSIVVPVFNPDRRFLRLAIESVLAQSYPHWQLCLVDDCSDAEWVKPFLKEIQTSDSRIKVHHNSSNGGISASSNAGVALSDGDWVTFLDHDDELSKAALFHLAKTATAHPSCQIIYTDEDKIDSKGKRYEPHFKSSWNLDLLYSQNYICHLTAYRRDLVQRVGGFRKGVEGSQDHDLLLRCLPYIDPSDIRHIPRVLYHWRAHPHSTAQSTSAKSYTTEAGLNALRHHFTATGTQDVAVVEGMLPNTYRVKWPLPEQEPLVSLLIPTRDRVSLVRNAVESILAKTRYPNFEIIILDNGSEQPETKEYFAEIQRDYSNIKIITCYGPFNFSAINNYGVGQARGEILGFINNDIEVIAPDWLNEMVSQAIRPDIGCVGAKLYYSNDTIQHAGVILGVGGVAGHSHKRFQRDDHGYFSRLKLTQNLSAVTAACMVMRRSVFEEVGGFEEEHLKVAFNDIDLCLKVREAGYRNLWTPYAELYHHESLSRGKEDSREKLERFRAESSHMIQKWKHRLYDDPYYNPNLTLMDENFGIAWKPRTDVEFPSIGQKLGRMLPKPIARRLIGILEFGH